VRHDTRVLAIVSTPLYHDVMTENRFPSIDLPSIDLPSIDADKVVELAKDAFYVTVGLGVLGYQQLQVRRNELKQRLSERLDSRKGQMDDVAKAFEARISALDERIQAYETKLDNVVEQVKDRLPTPAGDVLAQAHETARSARQQVRGLLTKAA
jgi:flagellar capping protein FliD